MSYSEARIQALENELFNLRQENQKLRVEVTNKLRSLLDNINEHKNKRYGDITRKD